MRMLWFWIKRGGDRKAEQDRKGFPFGEGAYEKTAASGAASLSGEANGTFSPSAPEAGAFPPEGSRSRTVKQCAPHLLPWGPEPGVPSEGCDESSGISQAARASRTAIEAQQIAGARAEPSTTIATANERNPNGDRRTLRFRDVLLLW